ncbi:MAG: hypothetical protein KDK30_05650 [Leptospiraceae bacterium]|nr:hypothetical protein [Leptospiraceae bacterium]
MKKKTLYRNIAITAFLAGLALLAMLLVSITHGGITAQAFEVVDSPESYAARILAVETPLRIILTFDNLFVVFYSAAFLFLALHLYTKRNRYIVYAATVAIMITAYLDFLENHHVLTLIASAWRELPISTEELKERMIWSQLKFHSSYLSLFLFGWILPGKTLLEKALKLSLLILFVPVGVLVYTYPESGSSIFQLLRYLLMWLGLWLLSWNYFYRLRAYKLFK